MWLSEGHNFVNIDRNVIFNNIHLFKKAIPISYFY